MTSLTATDKQYFEDILNMRSGWVLDFTDDTFEQLFGGYGIDIHSARYETYGTSKAKKLRAFWEMEPDSLVGQVLSEMVGVYKALCDSGRRKMKARPYEECRRIVARLCGRPAGAGPVAGAFEMPDVQRLPVDSDVYNIIQDRLEEARRCLSAEAYLSAVIMCGSVLEAVLLGAAQNEPKKFYSSPSSPKRKDGSAKPLQEWSLMELINVASNVGLLKTDAQGFSQVLRDFRNYIHPAKQVEFGFKPDEHTAEICLRVLKAALADVAGER